MRFQRQKCIDQYIADFYCFRAKLIIELDGGGHYDPESEEKDANRTKQLEKYGLKVIRFCNMDIDKNFHSVCTVIDHEVKERLGCGVLFPPALTRSLYKCGGARNALFFRRTNHV